MPVVPYVYTPLCGRRAQVKRGFEQGRKRASSGWGLRASRSTARATSCRNRVACHEGCGSGFAAARLGRELAAVVGS